MNHLLQSQLQSYASAGLYPLHMPGHKRRVVPAPGLPAGWDMTEVPGVDDLHDADGILADAMARTAAIIQSMTPLERENPQILNASRKKRIAAGCGLEVVDVNRLLKSFEMLQQMTKAMTKGGGMRGLGGMMGGFGGKVARGAMHGFGRKKRLK